jgi:hypothetical protein
MHLFFLACVFLLAASGNEDNPPIAGSPPAEVILGAYINDFQALNLREHSYAADVYIWFRWKDRTNIPTS